MNNELVLNFVIRGRAYGVNLSVQDLLYQDARIQNFFTNISKMKLSIISLFSVQIMSYLGASELLYSDVIDNFILEILKYKSGSLRPGTKDPGPRDYI